MKSEQRQKQTEIFMKLDRVFKYLLLQRKPLDSFALEIIVKAQRQILTQKEIALGIINAWGNQS